jgi:putative transposase
VAQRTAVRAIQTKFELSERRACALVGLGRSTCRYRPRRQDWPALRERLRTLAGERRRFGHRRLYVLLRREGFTVNRKRVYRLYTQEGLTVRQRKRRRRMPRGVPRLGAPNCLNERWSLDFVVDVLDDGRRSRILTVVDDFTRACLAIDVDTSIGGRRVAEVLQRLVDTRGKPAMLVTDNVLTASL